MADPLGCARFVRLDGKGVLEGVVRRLEQKSPAWSGVQVDAAARKCHALAQTSRVVLSSACLSEVTVGNATLGKTHAWAFP